MKALVAIFLTLSLILVGVYWFVNSELDEFSNSAKTIVADAVSEAISDTVSDETPPDSWSFAVVGDTEDYTPVTEKIIEDMSGRDLEFVAHVADITSHGEEEEMTAVVNAFNELPFPTYYVPGNNDLVYDESFEIKTPELYQELINEDLFYSIDNENAHLVFLDNSYLRFGFLDEELDWLKKDLDNAEADFNFIFYHRPLDVPGQQLFGDDETPFSREQNEKFKTLISNYEIERIFNGHLHTTMSYTINDIPITITGGGGGTPQSIFGGEKALYLHYYIVHVPYDGSEPTLEIIEIE